MPEIVPALRSALLTPIRNGDRTVLWAAAGPGLRQPAVPLAGRRGPAGARRGRRRTAPARDGRLAARTPAAARADRRPVGGALPRPSRPRLPPGLRRRLHPRGARGLHPRLPARHPVARRGLSPTTTPGLLTVNVRRGDYYSVTRFRGMYSFDVAEYLRVAVAESVAADGPVEPLRVVSDDPDWCRLKLPLPRRARRPRRAPRAPASPRALPRAGVVETAGAGELDVLLLGRPRQQHRPRDNHAQVWAPWFHRRDIDGGRAWHLDPRWSVVRDIPGGWDG